MAYQDRHVPFSKLTYACPHIDVSNVKKDILCTICPQARQTRLPFPSSFVKFKTPFELIHVDVCGPYFSFY